MSDRIQDLRQVQLHAGKPNTWPVLIHLACTLKTNAAEGRVDMAVRGKHILIADDYPDAIEIWAIYLRMCGYTVSTAGDGAEAVAQAEQLRPDLIVLDLEMPGISGFEAARRLRRHSSTHDIPLIAATGYSHHRQLSLARDAGFDRVMVKPIDPDSLVKEIEQLLDRYVSVRQPSHSAVQRAQDNG